MEEEPEVGKQGIWRGFRRERGGQMHFVVEDGVGERQGDGEEGQAQEAEGREPGPEEEQVGQVGRGDGKIVGEGEGAAPEGGRGSGSGEGEERWDSRKEGGDSKAGDRSKQQR